MRERQDRGRAGTPNMMRSLFGLTLLLLYSLVIVTPAWAKKIPRTGDADAPWEGRLVPRDFIPLLAPQNTLSLPFWRSESNSIQLTEIAPENKPVKAGEAIATFAFRDASARESLEERISKIRAQGEE